MSMEPVLNIQLISWENNWEKAMEKSLTYNKYLLQIRTPRALVPMFGSVIPRPLFHLVKDYPCIVPFVIK